MILIYMEYDPTESVYVSSILGCSQVALETYTAWNEVNGEWRNGGQHLLHYYDGRFVKDQIFSLFVFNSIERHTNNS